MDAISFPDQFHPLINALVSLGVEGSNQLDSLDMSEFEEWLAGDGYEFLLEGWKDEIVALDLIEFARWAFMDPEIRSNTEIDDDDVIDDLLRVAYAREQIEYEFSSGAETHILSVHRLPIKDEFGSKAILGYLMQQEGYGLALHSRGVYPSEDSYLEYLRRSGLLLHNETDSLTDKDILGLWQSK